MPKTKERSWIVMSIVAVVISAAGVFLKLFQTRRKHSAKERREAVNTEVMYEARDADASIVGWVALGVIGAAILIHFTVKLSYRYFSRAEFRSIQPVTMVSASPSPLNLPPLQVDPAADFEKFKASEEQTLNTYGWVDQQKGMVRVPIDEAMKRVVAQGLPAVDKSATTATAKSP